MGLILLQGSVTMLRWGNSERKAVTLNITCLQSEVTKTKSHRRTSSHLMGSKGSQPQGRAAEQGPIAHILSWLHTSRQGTNKSLWKLLTWKHERCYPFTLGRGIWGSPWGQCKSGKALKLSLSYCPPINIYSQWYLSSRVKTAHSFLWSLKLSQDIVWDELPFYMFISPNQTSQKKNKKTVSYCLSPTLMLSMVIARSRHDNILPSPGLKKTVKDYFLIYTSACKDPQKGTRPNHIQAYRPTSKSLGVTIYHKNNKQSALI